MTALSPLREDQVVRRAWPGVVAVTGALGAGKTAWTLDIGLSLHRRGLRVAFADLDIVNPYFCLREVADDIRRRGADIVLPPGEARWGDFPVVSPAVTRLLSSDYDHVFLDVGGEAKGVLALKQFVPFLEERGYDLLLVLNPFRPQSSTVDAVVAMCREMEALSGLRVTGLLGNAHLMEQTEVEDLVRGLALIRRSAEALALPLIYVGVSESLFGRARESLALEAVPLWPLSRRILFPWERSVPVDGKGTSRHS